MKNKPICPKCGRDVESFGSSCYPEDGVSLECTNNYCNYNLTLSVNHVIPEGLNLRLFSEKIHKELWGS